LEKQFTVSVLFWQAYSLMEGQGKHIFLNVILLEKCCIKVYEFVIWCFLVERML